MILSVTLSKPVKNISSILGDDYVRVKIKRNVSSSAKREEAYFAEFFTEKQVFHKKFSEESLGEFLGRNAGISFKVCVERTEDSEIQILANKKGKISWIEKKLDKTLPEGEKISGFRNIKPSGNLNGGVGDNRTKNHILPDGIPVPFLVRLGIQTAEGKVIASKYDKFRQINRFLEFVDDILPDVTRIRTERGDSSPVRVVDFGSGKSYLTFAVHYFLTEVRKIDCEVFGLDLKKDVIEYCSKLSSELGLKNLNFAVGDISDYSGGKSPDIVVTLHACDTATDYALDYAVKNNPARAQRPAFKVVRAQGFSVRAVPPLRPHKRAVRRPRHRRNPRRTSGKKRLQGADSRIHRQRKHPEEPPHPRREVRKQGMPCRFREPAFRALLESDTAETDGGK